MSEDTDLLQRSPEYLENLGNVRRMPQESPEERRMKHEAAQELRMNYLLDNAKLLWGTVQALGEDPSMDKKELAQYIQENFVVSHPGDVERFIENLVTTKEGVAKTIKLIKEEFPNDSKTIASEFYKDLVAAGTSNGSTTGSEPSLKGQVRFTPNRYPLAISLEVETEDDFKLIDIRKNRGGFFEESRSYHLSSDVLHYFPLIVVRGLGKERSIGHEEGHAEMSVFMSSLWYRRKVEGRKEETMDRDREVWGWFTDRKPTRSLENIERAFEEAGSIEDEVRKADILAKIKEGKDWHRVMLWATSKAKDEILAEMKPERGNVVWHLKNLTNQGGLYNYFERLGIPKDSPLNQLLWQDYQVQLATQTESVVELYDFYQDRSWDKRKELFRWVLAQVPMEKWGKMVKDCGFLDEADLYENIWGKSEDIAKKTFSTSEYNNPNIEELYCIEEIMILED